MAGALLNPRVLLGAWERRSRARVSGAWNVPRAQGPGPGRRRASWPRSPSPGRTCPGRAFPGQLVRTFLGTGFPRRGSGTTARGGSDTDSGVRSLCCPHATALPAQVPGEGPVSKSLAPCGWTPGCTLGLGDLPPGPSRRRVCDSGFAFFPGAERIFRNCGKERFLPGRGGAGPAQGTSWRPPAGPARGPLPRGWHAWQPSPQP